MADQLKPDPPNARAKNGLSRSDPYVQGDSESLRHYRRHVDITAMIRSLQRTEGLTDCFRRGSADCDQLECAWRQYCLGGLKD
ncbi:MAG: hypothetical protein HKP58_19935 [Desulfatitalea sp.]|nr:hypothetical protein [Desulfatitalea sp.]